MALDTTNVVAYWKLEEASGSRVDSIGSNTLTAYNSPPNRAGVLGNAISLDYNSVQYCEISDNAALSMADIDFTFWGWVYLDAVLDDFHFILMKGGLSALTAAGYEYFLRYRDSNGHFEFSVPSGTALATAGANATVGAWVFVVAWHDSVANTVNIQLNNGTPVSTSYSSGCYDGTHTFYLGSDGAQAVPWNGGLDAWGVAKRVLTSGERAELYSAGAGFEQPWGNIKTTDTATVSVSESRTIACSLSRTDSATVSATESPVGITVYLSRVDTATVSVSEEFSITAYLSRVDVCTVSATDESSIVVTTPSPSKPSLHYTINGGLLHYTIDAAPMQYAVGGRLDYTIPASE